MLLCDYRIIENILIALDFVCTQIRESQRKLVLSFHSSQFPLVGYVGGGGVGHVMLPAPVIFNTTKIKRIILYKTCIFNCVSKM